LRGSLSIFIQGFDIAHKQGGGVSNLSALKEGKEMGGEKEKRGGARTGTPPLWTDVSGTKGREGKGGGKEKKGKEEKEENRCIFAFFSFH